MQPASPDATLAQGILTALAEPSRQSPLPAILEDLCGRIAVRFRRLPVPEDIADDSVLTARWKLRHVLPAPSFPDNSGAGAHPWPGNQLTADDRRRLNAWGRLTGLPTNRLLHAAVAMLAESLRLRLMELLDELQETGVPFEELLTGTSHPAAESAADANTKGSRRSRHPRLAASTVEAADQGGGSPFVIPASADPAMPADAPPAPPPASAAPSPIPADIETAQADPMALAADPPSSGRSSRRRSRSSNEPAPSHSPGVASSPQILEQLQRTTDEIRVLRIAVDELHESLEHALRNPPETCDPPPFPPLIDLDLAADELLERLTALPTEILARLREQLNAPRDDLPPGQVPALEPDRRKPDGDRSAINAHPPSNGNGRHRGPPIPPPSSRGTQQRLF